MVCSQIIFYQLILRIFLRSKYFSLNICHNKIEYMSHFLLNHVIIFFFKINVMMTQANLKNI